MQPVAGKFASKHASKPKSITICGGFKYLVIETGYTGRLVQHIDDIKQKMQNRCYMCDEICTCANKLLFIEDTLWGKGLTKVSATDEEIAYIRETLTEDDGTGIIAFRSGSLSDALGIAQILMGYDHCACFGLDTLCKIRVANGDVLFLHFDCESG